MHATNILGQIFCTTIPAYPKVVKSSQERKDADGEMQQTGEDTSNSDEDGICQRMQWCMHNHTCIGSDLVLQISRHIGQNISCLFLHPNKLHVNFDGSAKNQGLRDHCYTLLPFISIYVIPLPLSKSDPALGGSKRQPGQGRTLESKGDVLTLGFRSIGLKENNYWALSAGTEWPLTGWHQYLQKGPWWHASLAIWSSIWVLLPARSRNLGTSKYVA